MSLLLRGAEIAERLTTLGSHSLALRLFGSDVRALVRDGGRWNLYMLAVRPYDETVIFESSLKRVILHQSNWHAA